MRKRSPIALPLQALPDELAHEQAVCPQCGLAREHQGVAIGRIGRRLVFRCSRCKARFFRVDRAPPHPPDTWDSPRGGNSAIRGPATHEWMDARGPGHSTHVDRGSG
jgi:hypothetical protein